MRKRNGRIKFCHICTCKINTQSDMYIRASVKNLSIALENVLEPRFYHCGCYDALVVGLDDLEKLKKRYARNNVDN